MVTATLPFVAKSRVRSLANCHPAEPSQGAVGCEWPLLTPLVDYCPSATPTRELHPVALQAHEPQVAALQAEVQKALSQAAADGASWKGKVMELQVSGLLLDCGGCQTFAVRVATAPRGCSLSQLASALPFLTVEQQAQALQAGQSCVGGGHLFDQQQAAQAGSWTNCSSATQGCLFVGTPLHCGSLRHSCLRRARCTVAGSGLAVVYLYCRLKPCLFVQDQLAAQVPLVEALRAELAQARSQAAADTAALEHHVAELQQQLSSGGSVPREQQVSE